MRPAIAHRLIAPAVFVVALGAGPSAAETIAALYERGIEAREAGDLEAAATAFERALGRDPGNADVRLQLGIVYSWQKRYAEALEELAHARAIAPDYVDVRVHIARICLWQGQPAEARHELDTILEGEPKRIDARLLRAAASHRLGDLEGAEHDFEAVLAQEPEALAALIGLGDLAAERRAYDRAERLYRKALAAHPGSDVPHARLSGLMPGHRWRVDSSFTYSGFAREEHDPWRRYALSLSYRVSHDGVIALTSDSEDRGFAFDQHFAASIDRQFSETVGAHLAAGLTPDADFREEWAVRGGVRLRTRGETAPIGPTWLHVDVRHASYGTGDVETLKPALVQHFADWHAWLTLWQISVWDEDGQYMSGWLTRADAQLSHRLHAFAGVGTAPETQEGRTVDTLSLFAGLDLDLSARLIGHLAYAYEDREDSYIRHALTAALTVRF
jgi:YaiO family outer membrane protein